MRQEDKQTPMPTDGDKEAVLRCTIWEANTEPQLDECLYTSTALLETTRSVKAVVDVGDFVVSINLADTDAPLGDLFLRFAFEWKVYQFR